MKKNPILEKIEIFPLDLPLKNPFVTALGRKSVTRNVLLILNMSGGLAGYGEASSSLAIPSASQDAMIRELISLKQELEGASFSEVLEFIERGRPEDIQATTFSALEMALYDVKARIKGVSLHRLFGSQNKSLETGLTVSAWPSTLAKKFAAREWKNGFRCFKIKIGTVWDQDLKRVLAVHEAVPNARLILDGNQGFTVPGIIEFMNELGRRNISVEFIEQPLPKDSSWEEWAMLKESITRPIALDESIATYQDAKDYVRRGLLDIINVKLAKSGIAETLRIIEFARQNKIRLMIGCMAESVIGLTTSVHLAAGTGAFDFVDLDSSYLLKPTKEFRGGFEEKGPLIKVASRLKGSGNEVKANSLCRKKSKQFSALLS